MFQKTDVKERIDNAFLELYAQKPVNEITVVEITKQAECNRRTYYTYYEDVYNQKHLLRDEFINNYSEIIGRSNGKYNEEVIEYFLSNRKFVKAFLGKYRDYNFLQQIIELHINASNDKVIDLKKRGSNDLTIYSKFYAIFGGLMSVTFWEGVDSKNVSIHEIACKIKEIENRLNF